MRKNELRFITIKRTGQAEKIYELITDENLPDTFLNTLLLKKVATQIPKSKYESLVRLIDHLPKEKQEFYSSLRYTMDEYDDMGMATDDSDDE